MPGKVNTLGAFRTHFICWRFIGVLPPKNYSTLYWLYSLVINVMISLLFPIHLMVGLLQINGLKEIMDNLPATFTCLVCSLKTFIICWRFDRVQLIYEHIRCQDERVTAGEEELYIVTKIYPQLRHHFQLFYILCSSYVVTSQITVLLKGLYYGTWQLIYQATYYPFDTHGSVGTFLATHLYQTAGIVHFLLQNLVNDTFAASHLILLCGKVRYLAKRLSHLGYDGQKTLAQNNKELLDCIREHMELMDYHHKLEHMISLYMFVQILFAGLNMCLIMASIVWFAENLLSFAYYGIFLVSVTVEILPSCYFGTILEEELQNIPLAAYASNWTQQNRDFRQNLKIFIEQTYHRVHITAWLFRINNNSFIIACKNAYSLFALVMNMR